MSKKPFTPIGLEVTVFCAKHAITKKRLAELAGVPYDTLLQIGKGRTEGKEAIPKLIKVMKSVEITMEK